MPSDTPDSTPTPRRRRNWDKKLHITDKDVEDFYKQTTGKSIFDRNDSYPAMTAAQMEGREHTDQVRRARLTQGEFAMPQSPYGDDDGTWSPMRTVVPWMSEAQINVFIERMSLTKLQDVVLRLRIMGFDLRSIANYIKWKTGYEMTHQSTFRVVHSLRGPLLELLTDETMDDERDVTRVYVQQVNRDITKPKSPYLQESKCDCATFPQVPVDSERTMRVPLNQQDSEGRELTHPVKYVVTAYLCAHCRKRRTQEQYDKLMAGEEF